ncbi:MAG: motility associated factor glycosyltransferase family protein [Coprococcus sp.]
MKTIYENNLNTLEQHHKTLWEAFSRDSSLEENEFAFVTQAKNGEWIVGCHMEGKDNYMNSTYNPAREAEKLMSEYAAMPENAFLCMFGLANGSFARTYLRENGEGVAIYVYEPSKEVFSAVMHNIDITELLADKRFHIVVEPYNADDFAEFLLDYISEANEFTNRYMAIPVYQKVFPESYDHYRQVIRDKYEYYRIQTNTLIKVGKEIGLASVRNMRFLPDCRSGAEYKNYFPEDIPAIIVAAGPSLKKNVDLLKEVKGKAVTIVVDSAINTVMAHGIVPDFAITVDTNKELKNFTAEELSDVFLLADATANTKALDMVKSKNLVFYSSDSATWQRMFREEGSSITEVFAGGSVALDAMALAKEWGFKRIIMIGQGSGHDRK